VQEIVVTDWMSKRLRFHGYNRGDLYRNYRVEIDADGLSAAFTIRTSGWGDRLSEFGRGLADDFAGWEGERAWRSLEDDLKLIATHHSGGYVKLAWTAKRYDDDWYYERQAEPETQWAVSIAFLLEAGEQMTALANDLEMFFKVPR
jgi:hypothetical protein